MCRITQLGTSPGLRVDGVSHKGAFAQLLPPPPLLVVLWFMLCDDMTHLACTS